MPQLVSNSLVKLALASISALGLATGCSAPTEAQAVDEGNAGVSTAALTTPPANAGFVSAGSYQVKNMYEGNYCMERRSDAYSSKVDGRTCSKAVSRQKWVAYAMVDGMYRLCVPDTLAVAYKYLTEYTVSYDAYVATCLGDGGLLERAVLSTRLSTDTNFASKPGNIDVWEDGHLISTVTQYALRLRVDDFRIDFNARKDNSNYKWTGIVW